MIQREAAGIVHQPMVAEQPASDIQHQHVPANARLFQRGGTEYRDPDSGVDIGTGTPATVNSAGLPLPCSVNLVIVCAPMMQPVSS